MPGMYADDEYDRPQPRAQPNRPPRRRMQDDESRRHSSPYSEEPQTRHSPSEPTAPRQRARHTTYDEYDPDMSDFEGRPPGRHESFHEDRGGRQPSRYQQDEYDDVRNYRGPRGSPHDFEEDRDFSDVDDADTPLSRAAQLEARQLELAMRGSEEEEARRQQRTQRDRATEEAREARMMAQIMEDSRRSARHDAARIAARGPPTNMDAIFEMSRKEHAKKEAEEAAELERMLENFGGGGGGGGGGQGVHRSQTTPISSSNHHASSDHHHWSSNDSPGSGGYHETQRRPHSMSVDTAPFRDRAARAPAVSSPLANVLSADSVIDSPTNPHPSRRETMNTLRRSTGADITERPRRPTEEREPPHGPQRPRPQSMNLPVTPPLAQDNPRQRPNSIPTPRAPEIVRNEPPPRARQQSATPRTENPLNRSNTTPNPNPQPQPRARPQQQGPSLRESLSLASRPSPRRSSNSNPRPLPTDLALAAAAEFSPRPADLATARRESLLANAHRVLEHGDENSPAWHAALATLNELDGSAQDPEEGLDDAFRPPSYDRILRDRVIDHRKYTTDSVKESEAGGLKVIDESVKKRMKAFLEVQRKAREEGGQGQPVRGKKVGKLVGVVVRDEMPVPVPVAGSASASASASAAVPTHILPSSSTPSPTSLGVADDIYLTLTRAPVPRAAPRPVAAANTGANAAATATNRPPAAAQERNADAVRRREASRQVLNAAFAKIPERSASRGPVVPRVSDHLGF